MLIDVLKERDELVDKGAAFGKQLFAVRGHFALPDVEQGCIRFLLHLQQGITLLECLVIVSKSVDIGPVILRDDHIHQPAAFVATAIDEQRVGGRDKDNRYQPDVLRQTSILLLVALEMLFRTTFHSTIDTHFICCLGMVFAIGALQHKKILIVVHDLRVDGREGTSAERQVIDGIQQVGLTLTVVTDEAIHLRRQRNVGRQDVFIVDDG